MAESERTIAIRVQAHLRSAGRPVPQLPDIIPLISTACEELARLIARDGKRRSELRAGPPFTLAIAGGEASLATLLAPPLRLLLEFLPEADVRDGQGRKLFYLGRDRYELAHPAQYGYFTFEGQTLLARLAGEEAGESDFTASLSANFSPAFDEVPPSCVPDLVLIVAGLIAGAPEGIDGKT